MFLLNCLIGIDLWAINMKELNFCYFCLNETSLLKFINVDFLWWSDDNNKIIFLNQFPFFYVSLEIDLRKSATKQHFFYNRSIKVFFFF